MESLDTLAIYKKMVENGIKFVDYPVLSAFSGYGNKNTMYKLVDRLVKRGVLMKLDKGKYCVADRNIDDFSVANFIYQPSYISLESALSYYGILSQFTYSITSVTIKKTRRIKVKDKEFAYNGIKEKLFTEYVKIGDFLIATKEKALADTAYFSTKGLTNFNLDEYDLSSVNKDNLHSVLSLYDIKVNNLFRKIL